MKTNVNKLSILLVQPNKSPKVVEIDDTLEAMQAAVGGDIESYMPYDDEVALICNEEGKLNGLTLNRAIYDPQTHEIVDIIVGDFFLVYAPEDSDRFEGLPEELMEKYADLFRYPERFFRTNEGISAVSYVPEQ